MAPPSILFSAFRKTYRDDPFEDDQLITPQLGAGPNQPAHVASFSGSVLEGVLP